MSPDGRLVAWVAREPDFQADEYRSQVWLAPAAGGAARQLTRGEKSSEQPAFSPDSQQVAFVSDRTGKRQVYVVDLRGGEARVLTTAADGIVDYQWSPDGRSIAYTALDAKDQALEARLERAGEFEVVGEDLRKTHLHLVEVATLASRRLTEGAFSVVRFAFSPDGTLIAFDHRKNLSLDQNFESDISLVPVAGGATRPLVVRRGVDERPVFSPDGKRVAFVTTSEDPDAYFYTTTRIATVSVEGGAVTALKNEVDESPILLRWGREGIYF